MKKTIRNTILIALALVLVCAASVFGTIAYLQDEKGINNTMTLGNVKIELIEQEWNADKTELVPFTQEKPLLPMVGTLAWENETEDGGAYRRLTGNNIVDKYVSVKNTGSTSAYVRTFIALEMGSLNINELAAAISASTNSENGSEFPGLDWVWTHDFVAEIDGKNYNIMVAVHEAPVAPGQTTIPSLLQVYMKSAATNDTVEKMDGNGNGMYDIMTFVQAVQVSGFEDIGADAALDKAFGDPEDVLPWD